MKKQKPAPAPGEKLVELYDGDVRISYDDANHSYVKSLRFPDGEYTDWEPTHGITTPLKMIPKDFLMPWAAKLTAYAALEWFLTHENMAPEVMAMLDDVALGKDKTERWPFTKKYGKWLTPIKAAYKKSSQKGKDDGHWIHEAIELFYNSNRTTSPIVSPDTVEGRMWYSFTEFDNFWKPQVEQTEFFVYSKLFGYSGQGDMKGVMSGKRVILDWKSTNRSDFNREGIDVEYFFQLGGLAQAEYERTGSWPDDVGIANFDKEGGQPIVVMASEFGMSPLDAAKAYVSVHNVYHTWQLWGYKFEKRY